MEEIKLSKETTIYKGNLVYDKQKVIDEVWANIDSNKRTSFDRDGYPGIQSQLIIRNGEWNRISDSIKKIILSDFYKNPNKIYVDTDWVFLTNNNVIQSGFHHHLDIQDKIQLGEWNYTFYAQMPEIIKENEGRLLLKDSLGEYVVIPEEGDFYIFHAKVEHTPEINPSSSNERIVLAGTIGSVDLSSFKRKTETTLF